VLTESGVVRSDITSSFGSASGTAEGVPVTVKLKVYDLNGDDATALAGAAVYLWHFDRDGNYSMYSDAVADATASSPTATPSRWPR
jgi:protocatechuate 3,4-dioxygenase beta subunit